MQFAMYVLLIYYNSNPICSVKVYANKTNLICIAICMHGMVYIHT